MKVLQARLRKYSSNIGMLFVCIDSIPIGDMSMGFLVVVILVILLFTGLPQVSGSWHSYGYAPSGLLTIVLVVLVVLILAGRV